MTKLNRIYDYHLGRPQAARKTTTIEAIGPRNIPAILPIARYRGRRVDCSKIHL